MKFYHLSFTCIVISSLVALSCLMQGQVVGAIGNLLAAGLNVAGYVSFKKRGI